MAKKKKRISRTAAAQLLRAAVADHQQGCGPHGLCIGHAALRIADNDRCDLRDLTYERIGLMADLAAAILNDPNLRLELVRSLEGQQERRR